MSVRSSEGPVRAATELWHSAFAKLSGHLKKEQLQTWFHRVSPVDFDGQTLILAVPSEFHRNWILDNYMPAIVVASSRGPRIRGRRDATNRPGVVGGCRELLRGKPNFRESGAGDSGRVEWCFRRRRVGARLSAERADPSALPRRRRFARAAAAGANGYPIGSSGDSAAARPLLAK